jgi:parallel beta-helix repeat protein
VYLSGGSHNIDIEDVTVTGSAAGTAFLVNGAVYNVNFARTVAESSYGHGYSIKQGSHDITFDHDRATGNRLSGFSIEDTSYNVLAEDCLAENNLGDGLLTGGAGSAVHDVTWRRCISRNNGTKTSTADGDGVTAHAGDYNIFIEYCSIYGNTASGLALVGTSGGHVSNTEISNNGGNWTGEGGIDQVRGGIYVITSGGAGWTFLNNISSGNYPREVAISTGTYTFDYNLYNPTGAFSNQGDFSFSYWQGLGYDIHGSLAGPAPAVGAWGLLVAIVGLGIVGLRNINRSRVS